MKKFSYHQRLADLKLESLELRRLHADLLFTYKLVFGIINLKLSDFLSQISIEQAAATNTNSIYLPSCKSSITACTVVQAVVKANSQSNGNGQISTPGGSKTP